MEGDRNNHASRLRTGIFADCFVYMHIVWVYVEGDNHILSLIQMAVGRIFPYVMCEAPTRQLLKEHVRILILLWVTTPVFDCTDAANFAILSSGILSDPFLIFIATSLGFNWQLVMLQLGLKQERVEQIQMDHPRSYNQILNALQDWREAPANINSSDMTAGGDGESNEHRKLRQLLSVLNSMDRQDLVDSICERFHVSVDDR